jgi:hypothetical protein
MSSTKKKKVRTTSTSSTTSIISRSASSTPFDVGNGKSSACKADLMSLLLRVGDIISNVTTTTFNTNRVKQLSTIISSIPHVQDVFQQVIERYDSQLPSTTKKNTSPASNKNKKEQASKMKKKSVWSTGVPSVLLDLIFSHLSSKQELLLTVERVCSTWAKASQFGLSILKAPFQLAL